MSLEWTAAKLISYKGGAVTPPKRSAFNPRPPGVLVAGSASSHVLEFLTAHRPRLYSCAQVLRAVRQRGAWSDAQVRWSLLYLRSLGLIESVEDPARNARYLRYRAKRQPRT